MALYSGIVQVAGDELCEDHGFTTIGSKDQCQRAAQWLADTHELYFTMLTMRSSKYPFGCFHYVRQPGWLVAYFNYHPAHRRKSNAEPICIR